MIYIIGGNGFVGSAIVRQCQKRELGYRVLTRENFDQFAGSSCAILINANGNSKKYMAERKPLWEFDASVRTVFQYLTQIQTEKYIQLSSCDVYPDCSHPEQTKENQPVAVDRQSAYGFHKYLAELCVQHYAKKWLIFRMGGFVGPGLKKNAVYDILHGGPLWLEKESELQFISTDAAAGIILDLALSEHTNEILNLCGDGTIKIHDILQASGCRVAEKPDVPKVRYEVNIDRLRQICTVEKTKDAVFSFLHGVAALPDRDNF